MLACQGLPFCGDGDDTEGNFQQITRLVSRHNLTLKNWLESKDSKPFKTTYMSGKSQNEFIQQIANAVCQDIANEVHDSGMFGVMADTTPDASNKDQLAVAIHCLGVNDPKERLIQVKEVLDEVFSSLVECNIDKEMMHSLT